MRQQQRTAWCGFVVALAIFAAACGGKETMASKSVAALRQAQAKGTPVTAGHGHGRHAVESAGDHSTIDHSTMDHSTIDHSTIDHATIDHATIAHSTMIRVDHSKMSGHDHSMTAAHDRSGTSGADRSTSGAHDHASMAGRASTRPAAATPAPRSDHEMTRVEPAATLRPDAFDAPAPAAVAEAAKASAGGGGAGHAMSEVESHRESAPASAAPRGATGDQSTVTYTCPMDPEVRSTTPGKCPKCGMTLVPAAPKKEQE